MYIILFNLNNCWKRECCYVFITDGYWGSGRLNQGPVASNGSQDSNQSQSDCKAYTVDY